MSAGKELQMDGAATEKVRRASSVIEMPWLEWYSAVT